MTAAAKEAPAPEDATQWICDPERVKVCPCAEADGDFGPYTCDCDQRPNIGNACARCGSPMILINRNTAERVEAAS